MIKKNYKCILWIFVIFLLILFGCVEKEIETRVRSTSVNQVLIQSSNVLITNPRKPRAWGHPQTIYVFADIQVWSMNQPIVSHSLERYFFTTENEQLFQLELRDIERFRDTNRFNNIIFLADINSDQPVSTFVKSVMSENVIDSVRQRNASMFMNNNLWASDQLVMFFLGDNPESLRTFLFENRNTYFQLFYDRFIARLTYSSRRLKGLDDSIFANLPFMMYIPETYRVFRSDLENNFISFIWRSREDQERNPDLYISVYWEYADENPLHDDWLFEKRTDLAWNHYDEDEFSENDVMRGLKNLGDRQVWFLSGRWQNQKYFIGGTFQSFAFYDEELQIAYLIDTSVYFPAGAKLKYLLELEGLAKTLIPINRK
ncbi:MAG: DUF4837 family protein [Candidatus Cloacimonetes bacterium]|nr:DUF4837 family protein [Candidatus Cloacimonadota bacterium]